MIISRCARISLLSLLLAVSGLPLGFGQGVADAGREAVLVKPLPEGGAPPAVQYRDLAQQAGLQRPSVSGGVKDKTYLIETTGTGVAIFDFDNDGLMDLFFVNSGRFGEETKPAPHYLYRNLGNLRFEDVTEKAGIVPTGWGQGVCAGDVDNDGYTDLYITHWGQDVLFRNRGDGSFVNDTKRRGLSKPARRWGTGCAFLDFDRDEDLDLFVAHYVDFDPEETPHPGDASQCRWKNVPIPCGPRGLPAETMALYENDGKGVYSDISKRAGVAVPRDYYGLGVLTGDFDNDGWTDVYVACDSTASLLFRNRKDGAFEEVGLLSGTAYNEDGQEQAGMGVAAADYDGNGLLDIFKTNFASDTNTLYHNAGEWAFTDKTVLSGLAVVTRYVGWGAAFLDFDHDGRQDIFAVNGHVSPSVDGTPINESFRQPRLLFWNRGDGAFHPVSSQAGPAFEAEHSSRGVAVGDLDNDGSQEIVVVNMNERPSLLKHSGDRGNWLLVRALTRTGRDAIGARISATAGGRTLINEVRSGGSYISQNDFRVHFGLGDQGTADVVIRWPTGAEEKIPGVKANQRIEVREGKGIVAPGK